MRIDPIPQRVLRARRERFQAEIDGGLALLAGARVVPRSNDVDHIFRQRSDLLYLCGFPQPDAVAVLTRDRFVLFVQERDPDAETWTGRRPGVEGAVRDYGADEAHPIGELGARLPAYLENVARIFHWFGLDPEIDRLVLSAMERVRARGRSGVRGPDEVIDPRRILHEMRLRKDPEEIAVMRAGAEITREGHHSAARLCRAGRYEYELEATLQLEFRRRGGAGPAYPSIIGSGANGTILHYIENSSRLEPGQLVLIDAGVELHGYASDVTRTYPVGGRFEGAGRDVYAAVLRAQLDGLESAHAGTTLAAIHEVTTRSLVKGLVELGALDGDPETLFEEQAYKPYYMHGTSHFLGLDVHDVGAYHVDGKPRALEPGMVFTVEPGLYFAEAREEVPEALRGIGVRIEDDVLIREDGIEILTASIPKEIDEVEAWMRD